MSYPSGNGHEDGWQPYGPPPGAERPFTPPYTASSGPGPSYGAQMPYPGGPYAPGPYPGYPFPQAPQNNGKSVAALVCGIVSAASIMLCCFSMLIAVPSGIVALVLGVQARREIERSAGAQAGDGMALAGIITGGIGIALSVALTLAWFAFGLADYYSY